MEPNSDGKLMEGPIEHYSFLVISVKL